MFGQFPNCLMNFESGLPWVCRSDSVYEARFCVCAGGARDCRMWERILLMMTGSPHSGQTVTVEADRGCDRTKARLSGASLTLRDKTTMSVFLSYSKLKFFVIWQIKKCFECLVKTLVFVLQTVVDQANKTEVSKGVVPDFEEVPGGCGVIWIRAHCREVGNGNANGRAVGQDRWYPAWSQRIGS